MQNANKTTKLNKLIARLDSQTPLIGWELRWMAVKALVKDGSLEALDALADTLIRSKNRHVRKIALEALLNLAVGGKPEAQEALCRLVVEHDHPVARQTVFNAQYVPHDPNRRGPFVKMLAENLIHNDDLQIRQNALKLLKKIAAEGTPEAQEALCQLVIEYDHPLAHEVVLAAQYTPGDPYQRALLYALTGQWDKYEQLDFTHNLLGIIYRTAGKVLQRRIVVSARQGGRVDLLVSFVTGGKRVDRMTNKDWKVMLATLSKNGNWAELWYLAQTAPIIWSVRLLLRLKEAGWMPEQEAERVEFTKLLRLAEECSRRDTDTLGWLVYCHSTLEGHTDDIRCLAISPDGQVLASGSNDNTVRLWDLPDGAALKRLRGHTGVLVTGLPYWEYRKRSALRTLKGHACMVTCLAICPEGQVLASGGGDHTVRLWSLPGGMALQTLKGHTNQVNCVAISPDGRILVSGGKDHTVRLWDLPEGTTVKKLKGFADNVRCLTISPDGRILASGSNDHTIRLWSLPDGTALHTLEGHTQSITCLAISPDGRILVSGSDDHTIRLWSLPDGAALHPLIGHTAGVSCLAISPDGKVLASGGFDRAIRLWIVGKVELSRLIIEQTSLKELKLIQERAQEREVADAEGRWLEFILELMRWQRRFDIEVGEALQKISLGEFDIEIEA